MKSLPLHALLGLALVMVGVVPMAGQAADKRALPVKPPRASMSDRVLERLLQEAFAQLDAGATDVARPLLEKALQRAPHSVQALGGMGIVHLRQGRHADAVRVLEQAVSLGSSTASAWQPLLDTARFWEELGHARRLRDQGDLARSEQLIRQALVLAPSSAEALALLAHVRELQKDDAQAMALYSQALASERANPSAVRGLAGLLMRQRQWQQAMDLLDGSLPASRAPGNRYSDLQVAALRGLAADWLAQGQSAESVRALQSALVLEPGNAWVRFDLASAMLSANPSGAQAVMQEGLALVPASADMAYASALVYATLGDAGQALALLDGVPIAAQTEPMAALHRQMRVRVAAGEVVQSCRSAGFETVRERLASSVDLAGNDSDLLGLLASTYIDCQQGAQAVAAVRAAIDREAAPPMALRLLYLSVLGRTQQVDLLRAELGRIDPALLTPEQHRVWSQMASDLAYLSAEQALAGGQVDQAAAIAEGLVQAGASGARLALLQGKVLQAQGFPGPAWASFSEGKRLSATTGEQSAWLPELDAAMVALLERRQGQVSVGFSSLRKPGTAGQSEVRLDAVPLEVSIPLDWDGNLYIQATPVRMQAGTLDRSDTYALMRYGKIQALVPSGSVNAEPMEARGTALSVGYQSEHWRVEAGTTPVGFPVQDGVGRLGWRGACQAVSCALELSKTPVTDSLLSYAGAQDPASGSVWGGVRATALNWRVQAEKDSDGADLHLGYRYLDGREVLSNRQWDMGAEVHRVVMQSRHARWTVGLAYTFWSYEHDLNHFTFGHGGYYSPQTYHAVSIPWRLEGQRGELFYKAEGSFFSYWGGTKDMLFYPTDASLQSAAGNPKHLGERFSGDGYTLAFMLERRWLPGWVAGGRLEIGRSPYYTPNAIGFYLRYQWTPERETISRWPTGARAP